MVRRVSGASVNWLALEDQDVSLRLVPRAGGNGADIVIVIDGGYGGDEDLAQARGWSARLGIPLEGERQ